MVGPRGQGLLKALRLGSTAEWLMRCPNSALVIARRPVRTRSVLVCVDSSRHAQAAVDCLASMPWNAGAYVTVLGVLQWHENLPASVTRATRELAAVGAHATLVVEPDRPAPTVSPHVTIFESLGARGPDLVVLGTSGRSPLKRLWAGSVASTVGRHAKCSVMLVRDARCAWRWR